MEGRSLLLLIIQKGNRMTWLLFFILTLFTARITWLITEDHLPLIAKPRDWIVNRNPNGNIAYLVECWYCVSIYVAAGASAYAVWVLHNGDWRNFLLYWPALSMAAVGIMGAIEWLSSAPNKD